MEINSTLNGGVTTDKIPGYSESFKTKSLSAASNLVQSFKPINDIKVHLCGFAYYVNDPTRQVELHHFCSHLNEEVIQCAVYDGEESGSRLIGVEYVITERLFATLPIEEQKYWHSHQYDIHSGSFIAPDLPLVADHALAKDLATTYGKTWVFWQVDRGDVLPFGEPQLMGVATGPNQWNPKLFSTRANRRTYKPEDYIENHKDLGTTPPHPNADSWQKTAIPTSTGGVTSMLSK